METLVICKKMMGLAELAGGRWVLASAVPGSAGPVRIVSRPDGAAPFVHLGEAVVTRHFRVSVQGGVLSVGSDQVNSRKKLAALTLALGAPAADIVAAVGRRRPQEAVLLFLHWREATDEGRKLRLSGEYSRIARLWEDRPERVPAVARQVEQIAALVREWGFDDGSDQEYLDHATIAYSTACGNYEGVQWLPFEAMPGWQDDLWCILMDEDFWRAGRRKGEDGAKIAARLRKKLQAPVRRKGAAA